MLGSIKPLLLLLAVAAPGVASAQEIVFGDGAPGAMPRAFFEGAQGAVPPAFIQGPGGSFRQVSAAELLVTPAAQREEYSGVPEAAPSPAYGDSHAVPLPPLQIPDSKIKCCLEDPQGHQCKVDRFLKKPAGINPDCLICVKEPYVTTEPVVEKVEVVLFRCFETTVPFKHAGCEDGTWYKKVGEKKIRRLRPCTTLVDLKYDKKVVRYRDVWYHVRCD